MNITEADLRKFTPKANKEYVTALLDGMDELREAGILESPFRLCHFMAQVAHETGGFTIIRESLHYTSTKRIREVWPARFRNKSDAELKPLVKNGIALGDAVYMGRMGNALPGDGYAYRGGGFLQTTGRSAVERYAKCLNVTPSPTLLDDVSMTLRFACLEWKESNCCEYADENDLTKVSKAINVGSATSNVKPVGIADRQAWFAKAWAVWGEKGKADKPVISDDVKAATRDVLIKAGGTGAVGGGGAVAVSKSSDTPKPADPPKPTVAPKETVSKAKETAKEIRENVEVAKDYYSWAKPTAKAAYENAHIVGPLLAVIALAIFWPKVKERLPWG